MSTRRCPAPRPPVMIRPPCRGVRRAKRRVRLDCPVARLPYDEVTSSPQSERTWPTEAERAETTMPLARALAAVRHRWPILVVGAGLGLLAGLAYNASIAPSYRATATVFFSLDRAKTASDFSAGSMFAQSLMPSYAEIVTMPVVLEPVIADLKLEKTPAQLAPQISVTVPTNSVLMDISVTDGSAAQAAAIANGLA